eukprot:scaffold23559_cov22-Tisochrysis_lutea.AAC.1
MNWRVCVAVLSAANPTLQEYVFVKGGLAVGISRDWGSPVLGLLEAITPKCQRVTGPQIVSADVIVKGPGPNTFGPKILVNQSYTRRPQAEHMWAKYKRGLSEACKQVFFACSPCTHAGITDAWV